MRVEIQFHKRCCIYKAFARRRKVNVPHTFFFSQFTLYIYMCAECRQLDICSPHYTHTTAAETDFLVSSDRAPRSLISSCSGGNAICIYLSQITPVLRLLGVDYILRFLRTAAAENRTASSLRGDARAKSP
jgi:hypothetical protein